MGQILHGSAGTTAALRRTIQHSQESIARLAERYDLNAKTVAKWRKRTTVGDAPMGPRQPCSTVLTAEQEATIVAFRQRTLLALDDCLYTLQASITNLTRSSLHRCLQRHGISRLPEIEGDKPKQKKFANYAIDYFHADIAEVHTEQGRLYLFVAIDRTSKFAYAELHPDQTRDTAYQFLRRLIAAVPYRIHTVLTDNGIRFTNRLKDKWAFKHLFDRACTEHGIEHRLTKAIHPWTNGQIERMNRTIKDATVKRYHYETHEQLQEHLAQFLAACNFAKRLKTLWGPSPYEHISKCWQKEPERFRLNPHYLSMRLNT
ncbi:MAG: IS481 family transposase [Acidobacteria bacterium]|nr:IS481 family transposase [Acidobacteriota bacterium]